LVIFIIIFKNDEKYWMRMVILLYEYIMDLPHKSLCNSDSVAKVGIDTALPILECWRFLITILKGHTEWERKVCKLPLIFVKYSAIPLKLSWRVVTELLDNFLLDGMGGRREILAERTITLFRLKTRQPILQSNTNNGSNAKA
jgi:hypothetical protein